MFRRSIAAIAALAAFVLAAYAPSARAAAEVHKLSLLLSIMPTEVKGDDLKTDIDWLNDTFLTPSGLEGLDAITYGWMFGAELRYFVRSSWTIDAGVGQLMSQTKREYLPALGQATQLRAEILSVPIHAGASYYFAPYNQGDFQARAFLGGGLLSHAINRVTFQVSNSATTGPLAALGPSQVIRWNGSGPGFYGEGGVHMFFASRFSVLLSASYRDAKADYMIYTQAEPSLMNEQVNSFHDGTPFHLDAGGIGFRMAVAIGL